MEIELTKETAKKLMEIKGEARGVHFKNDAEFILKEKGKEGLGAVEKEFKKLGYPMKYKEINQFDFYPVGLRAVSLLAIKKAFDWPDEKIEEVGSYAMKVSWIIRLLMKYFFSIEKVLEDAPKTWSKYFTVGRLKVEEFNFGKKYLILRIEEFSLHPLYCRCLKGVFLELGRMVTRPQEISCRETKCSFRDKGEEEHCFLIEWR